MRAISSCASWRSSGGSARALSLITSTAVPPLPERDNRTEGRIVGYAGDQLARLWPQRTMG